MSFQIAGLAEYEARVAALKASLKSSSGAALAEAVDEQTTQPARDRVPVEFGVARDSGRTVGPFEEGDTATVVSTFGRSDDGDAGHASSDEYVVAIHEDLALVHPNGGEAKFLERTGLESARLIAPTVRAKMRGR